MKSVLLVLLLVSATCGTLALTSGEEQALLDIFNNWPNLAILKPAWSSNVSEACYPEPFYGVSCIYDGDYHVSKLYVGHLYFSTLIYIH